MTLRLRLPLTPLAAALLSAVLPLAGAQTAPGAGSLLQQVQPVTPPAPATNGTGLKLDQPAAALPASAPLLVKQLTLSGNTVFDSATLHVLVADAEGQMLTLPELGLKVARITDYYRAHGYPLARAIIPAQRISGGLVAVQVLEARYGAIRLHNASRLGTGLLDATLAPLQSGRMIEQDQLDRTLLLLSDIPGVATGATLKPGAAVGSSDLLVEASAAPAVSGTALLDNNGNRYTGRARLGATLAVNNPWHLGDQLSVSALTAGSGLTYGHLGYEIVVNGTGTRLGGGYSALHYQLGGPLRPLDAHGNAQVENLWLKQPLLRGQRSSLNLQLGYDEQKLHDAVDVSAITTDRHVGTWSLNLAGDIRDGLLYGAVSSASVGWSHGQVRFRNGSAALADAQTAGSAGDYGKWNVTLARLQSLGASDSLYLVLAGQRANGNLDASEKLLAGGSYSVRAYDIGAVAGDSGYVASAEWRHDLGSGWGGRWLAIAFIDSARLTVNQAPWAAGPNSARLSGTGIGLNWAGSHSWAAKATLATVIGATPALVPDNNAVRVWVELSRGF